MYRTEVYALTILFLIHHVNGKSVNLKICVVGNPEIKNTRTNKYCDLLERSKETPVTCQYEPDRLECLWAVTRQKADFAVFQAEDLFFSTSVSEQSILVVGEVKALKQKPYQYGVVVVVRNRGGITKLQDLSGKRLCHPGTESGMEWNFMFSQYFEERVASSNCEENLTLLEDRIKTTSRFFESACKAGPWSVNVTEDARLKQKYSNLCALCDGGDCGNAEKYRGSGGSITCFKDGIGDVLWARLEDVQIHLRTVSDTADDSQYNYSFLCDDGRSMPITSEKPCIWLAKPWQVIGAHPKSVTQVQKLIEVLTSEKRTDWEQNLIHIIELYSEYIENLPDVRTPEDYLRGIPGYLSASSLTQGRCNPRHSVKLCVTSVVEQVKCTWISKAAAAVTLRPSLECIEKFNLTDCLESAAAREVDVTVVPPDFLYEAISKYNLKTFLSESGTSFDDSCFASAVVKKSSTMKVIEDLKNKKACFTKRNGMGWRSAVTVLEEKNLIQTECTFDEGLSRFFKEICVINKAPEDEEPMTCCPGYLGGYDAEVDILHCLQRNGCDVAFMDFRNSRRRTSKDMSDSIRENFDLSNFREICKSEDECRWMWSSRNFLMYSSEVTEQKAQEAFNLFYLMGQVFGKKFVKYNSLVKLFGSFSSVSNILFMDSSIEFVAEERWDQSNNYRKAIENMKFCSEAVTIVFFPSIFALLLLMLTLS